MLPRALGPTRPLSAPPNKHYRISTLVAEDTSGDIETVTVDVSSAAGRETVTLTETDAWLHGAAPLAALPTADAALSLTLYDSASASLIAYSGRLGTDGSVTLTERASTCDPNSRLGCTVTEAPGVELLAAEVFASAGGYEVSVDLTGSAAHDVAYAELRVGDTTTEVGWESIGTVWEGELTLERGRRHARRRRGSAHDARPDGARRRHRARRGLRRLDPRDGAHPRGGGALHRRDHHHCPIPRVPPTPAGRRPTPGSLDQSILARAFRGELVEQDPNDEPADVLLARLRASTPTPTTRGRRARG